MDNRTQEMPAIKPAEQQPRKEAPETAQKRPKLRILPEVSPGAQKAKERLGHIGDMADGFTGALDQMSLEKIDGLQRELDELRNTYGSEIKDEAATIYFKLSDARKSIAKAQEARQVISRQPSSAVRRVAAPIRLPRQPVPAPPPPAAGFFLKIGKMFGYK